ncbi:Dyp-type peroxidase [Actinoplanes bogorensis]|uniref:Dyp-type peroxidase n=1 Tax=Paractinoplanes bogorensis TaxID=1610840 RepID=A0ABS5YS14_9ACTN|nr:Dyp-type peroxidase domain-containing protein [Actinoplanes bogorensis]MBU2666106.1 Dyp-type peroxidase [Actinoplanes bogorensis]
MSSPLAELQKIQPEQIQGNILRPFGGKHQAFLAVSFRNQRVEARRWLAGVASRVAVTTEVPGKGDERLPEGTTLLNVGLTATGLTLLHPETASSLAGFGAFWNGPLGARVDDDARLTTAPALLGDIDASDPVEWVVGGVARADGRRGTPVDALLTIAAGDPATLESAVRREREAAGGFEILHDQRCEVLYDEVTKRRIEHFGYTDGISQPLVADSPDTPPVKSGPRPIAAGEFIVGYPAERRPQSWAPRPRPAGWMRGGSFQVFRRLVQDPQKFWDRIAELAGTEAISEDDAFARTLGRHLDGRPLAAPDASRETENVFTYESDRDGRTTPFSAHIRKVNPREDVVFRDRGHKMLRRGLTFGPRFVKGRPDGAERGMVFNSYMASIEDQFESVQRRWARDPNFPSSTLVKYGRIPAEPPPKADGLDPITFGGSVTNTGAVYAFAPSLPALLRLAGDDNLDT